ncbi:hypothetical protein GGH94_004271 [Coemansia aciculifera]|uniref:Uncharacterized protein n=1 Tax=Coemansia aciculifera TaxID=417176 RepID=A0A9W8IKP2_9FUNG|nr:hypothetical protein GGH94_004271 [Coemansia aciculifera]
MVNTSSGPARLSPSSSPPPPPHLGHQSRSHSFSPPAVHTTLTRQNSVPAKPAGKPSPYTAKVQPDDSKAVQAGIGGPPKRRESLSGMGNNLRSHHHAGLGRSVAKSSNIIQSSPPPPLQSPPRENPHPVHRRGSVGTASAITSDASQRAAGHTVFPTNRGYATQAISRPFPGLALPANSQSPPPVGQIAQSPLRVRVVHRARSVSEDRRASPQSSPSPTSAGLDIGSPGTGHVVDIVGSPSRPSVIYASADRGSNIGGGTGSKQAMQEKFGMGGKHGKDWMADRPSGIGAPAPQDMHPESGLSKILRSLSISRKD